MAGLDELFPEERKIIDKHIAHFGLPRRIDPSPLAPYHQAIMLLVSVIALVAAVILLRRFTHLLTTPLERVGGVLCVAASPFLAYLVPWGILETSGPADFFYGVTGEALLPSIALWIGVPLAACGVFLILGMDKYVRRFLKWINSGT
jgi:hypothetical protein